MTLIYAADVIPTFCTYCGKTFYDAEAADSHVLREHRIGLPCAEDGCGSPVAARVPGEGWFCAPHARARVEP